VSTPTPRRAHGVSDLSEFAARLTELKVELDPPQSSGEYIAHTDGACLGNPDGPGGWAAVVQTAIDARHWWLWGHLSSTSNNRAEALGVLAALEWIPPDSRLVVYSDSQLTVRILQGRYKAKANPDIWELIRRTTTDKRLKLTPEWLRGHAGDPGNELADRLSVLGANNRGADGLDSLELAIPAPPAEPPELAGVEPQGEWERDFLRSVGDQLRRGRQLSPKQQAIVDRIRARTKT
jgi:ribonuclease HI